MPTPGYSGTPLPKKLGLKTPMTLAAIGAPKDYRRWLGRLPDGLRIVSAAGPAPESVHLFVTRRAGMKKHLVALRKRLVPAGFVWVSWPKKAAKMATDVTEDRVREAALRLDLVDVKVAAVDEVWSGLKLAIRKERR